MNRKDPKDSTGVAISNDFNEKLFDMARNDDWMGIYREVESLIGGGWLPISSAPTDGTRVFTCYWLNGHACDYQVNHYNDPNRVARGHGLGSKGWWRSAPNQQPTHWLPIPRDFKHE